MSTKLVNADQRHVFGALNGLRGVAAISVAVHHMSDWPVPISDPLPQAGLAVDMFFVMSGFVLAHAYQHRFDSGMTSGAFMRARLVRLWPLYALGSFLKLLALLCFARGDQAPLAKVIASVGFGVLFLPTPVWLAPEGRSFPFNRPAWSLFFELAANYVWVTLLRRSRPTTLIAVCAIAGCVVVVTYASLTKYLIGGAPRVAYCFFAGILCYQVWQRWPSTWRFPHGRPFFGWPSPLSSLQRRCAALQRWITRSCSSH